MLIRKKIIAQIFIAIICLFTPMIAGAVSFVQIITMEKDGSGIIKLIYSEKESLVKEKNFVVGNLPFTKEKSAEYFNSSNTSIRLFEISKDPKDNTLIQITVSMNFKDISSINEMKALPDAKVSITETDTGKVFVYTITPEFTKSNSISYLFTILTYNGVVKSSNGKIEGKNVQWSRSKEYIDAKKVMDVIATLESDVKTTSKDSGNKEKSCGLFGVELPLIIFLGFAFTKLANRKKV
ncbi:MAG: hypothetical protein IPH77_06025 [Ignavibacteria bacterium]|nr:hypothetical protein [Ignavibacteria bacterium]